MFLLKFSVSPGNVWTPLWDQLARSSGNFEKSKKDGDEAQVTQTDFFSRLILNLKLSFLIFLNNLALPC